MSEEEWSLKGKLTGVTGECRISKGVKRGDSTIEFFGLGRYWYDSEDIETLREKIIYDITNHAEGCIHYDEIIELINRRFGHE